MSDEVTSKEVRNRMRMLASSNMERRGEAVANCADPEKAKMCKGCLHHYMVEQGGYHWPMCAMSADMQVQADLRSGLLDSLSDDEKLIYQYTKDPVTWARLTFNYTTRWYQSEMLRCSAKKVVVRAGRRLGKCLAVGTRVDMADGSRVKVEELVGREVNILGFDGNTTVVRKATAFKDEVKECVELTLKSGRVITVSTDHPVMTFMSWTEAGHIKLGDRIGTQKIGIFGAQEMDPYEVDLLALCIGDGGLTQRVKFTNTQPKLIALFSEICSHYGCTATKDDITYCSAKPTGTKKNPMIEVMRKHGLFGKNAHTKFLPSAIQRLPKAQLARFLSVLFSTDGWATNTEAIRQIGYCSVSFQLVRDVQECLSKFGIRASVRKRRTSCAGKQFSAFTLSITDSTSFEKFGSSIGIYTKQASVRSVCSDNVESEGKSYTDTLPKEAWNLISDSIGPRSIISVVGDVRIRKNSGISYRKASSLAKMLGNTKLEAESTKDLVWDVVVGICSVGKLQTYDVSILEDLPYDVKGFSAEGVFVHNTDALAVRVLHSATTKPTKRTDERYTVLIICPYERQVGLIFDRIREFIARSPALANSVTRDVHNPERIDFSNMSSIIGIPAGVRTGAKADQVRGQDGDLIVLDEADYLDEGSIDSIMAILSSNPDCQLWASSTPTGNRSFFYKWCTEKQLGFREFHFRSKDSPSWSDEVELFYRQTYTEAAYKREFDAEFGDTSEGVFQNKYVDRSIYDYELDGCTRTRNNLYVMGVDWNSTTYGTRIVVTEYDLSSYKFRLVDKAVIDANEFTQRKSIEKIIDMDSFWKCDYIYVDAGYGATQVEDLKSYGIAHPKSKMATKIRPIDFGSKTLIRDPFTKELIKKHTKPLVVEMAARRMESGQCILPRSEDSSNGLIGQIRGYQVLKYGRDGQPIYSTENEHTLVAWMLSIFGLIMEFTDVAKVSNATTVRFVAQEGMPQIGSKGERDNDKADRKKRLTAPPRWVVTNNTNDTTLQRLSQVQNVKKAETHRRINSGTMFHKPGSGRSNF